MLFIVASQNLKNKIAAIIPNCIIPPVCTTGQETITLIRTTQSYADEEYLVIRDLNDNEKFSHGELKENQQYIWNVDLCKGEYKIVLTDTYGDGWDDDSNVVIKKGSTTIGIYTCEKGENIYTCTYTFTV